MYQQPGPEQNPRIRSIGTKRTHSQQFDSFVQDETLKFFRICTFRPSSPGRDETPKFSRISRYRPRFLKDISSERPRACPRPEIPENLLVSSCGGRGKPGAQGRNERFPAAFYRVNKYIYIYIYMCIFICIYIYIHISMCIYIYR